MGNKLMTGLAISLGAGLALTVTTRANRKEKGLWHPAKADGTMTPVTVRVHKAVSRAEREEIARAEPQSVETPQREDAMALSMPPERSAELAELRVMINAIDQRGNEMLSTVNQRIDELQNHLPRFIDIKVTSRMREVEDRLRTEFQDEQSKTLDAFLRTLDQKVLPRIALVEEAVGAQGAEVGMMRQRIEKTDETLDRVLERIEKVVDAIAVPYPGYTNSHVMEIHKKAVA